MYEFIKIQWILGKYSETNMANCVTKKFITQKEADEIMTIPQVVTSDA